MDVWKGIKHAINSTLGTTGFLPLDKLMSKSVYTALDKRVQEFTVPGAYTVYIPYGARQYYLTACGAGGGGGGAFPNIAAGGSNGAYGGGGGAGGYTNRTLKTIPTGETISVTVGAGGIGGAYDESGYVATSGADGGNTVVGSTTFAGGKGGEGAYIGYDGKAGAGGGNGASGSGKTGGAGFDGIHGSGGNGGEKVLTTTTSATGKNGANGYVKIEWVW